MSRLYPVTPYHSSKTSILTKARKKCSRALHRLVEDTPEDRAAIHNRKQRLRHKRLTEGERLSDLSCETVRITTVEFNIPSSKALKHTAEKLNYHVERAFPPSALKKEEPVVLLRSPTGQPMVMGRNSKGRVVIHTAGPRQEVVTLVRQYTEDQAIKHFTTHGMCVEKRTLSNGEVEFTARRRDRIKVDRDVSVDARLGKAPAALIDERRSMNIPSSRVDSQLNSVTACETQTTKTGPAHFILPRKPAKTMVRIGRGA